MDAASGPPCCSCAHPRWPAGAFAAGASGAKTWAITLSLRAPLCRSGPCGCASSPARPCTGAAWDACGGCAESPACMVWAETSGPSTTGASSLPVRRLTTPGRCALHALQARWLIGSACQRAHTARACSPRADGAPRPGDEPPEAAGKPAIRAMRGQYQALALSSRLPTPSAASSHAPTASSQLSNQTASARSAPALRPWQARDTASWAAACTTSAHPGAEALPVRTCNLRISTRRWPSPRLAQRSASSMRCCQASAEGCASRCDSAPTRTRAKPTCTRWRGSTREGQAWVDMPQALLNG